MKIMKGLERNAGKMKNNIRWKRREEGNEGGRGERRW